VRIRTTLAVSAILASLSLPAQAELILSGIPAIQERTELDKNFIKLASQLTDVLGEPVRYVAPINEMGYAQEVRKGTYDIVIDNPVLAAWRIAKGMHKPVAQVDVPSTYLVVVPATDTSTKSPEQLIGKSVCVCPVVSKRRQSDVHEHLSQSNTNTGCAYRGLAQSHC